MNSWKTTYEDLVECANSLVATSRLSRNIQKLVVNLVHRRVRAALALTSAATASASNTLALHPIEKDL
jgi:hypothetical protein